MNNASKPAALARISLTVRTRVRAGIVTDAVSATAIGALVVVAPRPRSFGDVAVTSGER